MLVNYKLKNLFTYGSSRLQPGMNNVDKEQWAKDLKLFPKLKYLLDDNAIEVVEEKLEREVVDGDEKVVVADEVRQPVELDDLKALNEKKATQLIRETGNAELLNHWQETDRRPAIQKAIAAQFQRIDQAAEPAKKD